MKNRTIVAQALTILLLLVTVAILVWTPSVASTVGMVLGGAASAFGIAALVLSLADRRAYRKETDSRIAAAQRTQMERESAWEGHAAELEANVERLQSEAHTMHETRIALKEAIRLVRETEPIISGLAQKAVEKSEHGSNTLTEDIYELGRQSTSLSESISGFLQEMSMGDDSLQSNIGALTLDMKRLGEVTGLHDEANTSLDRSITRISESVGETSELLGQVSDIAEQTSILAINAAIYAAKAGEFGPGFSVIAGEIQKLAGTAKEVAETIGTNTTTIERQVAEFSKSHHELMNESQASLTETIDSIRGTVHKLQPKAERISGQIENAADVSASVSQHLNGINMAMQEQDAIQQIVSHIAEIFRETLEQVPPSVLEESMQIDGHNIRERARKLAARHFTMKDEFVAVGQDGYNAVERQTAVLEDGTRLGGDVTLF